MLLQKMQQSKLTRRGFIRSAMLLGLSVGAEEALGLALVRLAREQNHTPAAAERDFAIAPLREL
jgi:hypothetical protein